MNLSFPLSEKQKKERQVLIQDLKKEPIVQAFLHEHALSESIVSEKAQMLSDYVAHKRLCDNCPGLHACKQSRTGYVLGLQVDPLFTWELQACAYQQSLDQLRSHRKQYSVLDVDPSFLEVRMEELFDKQSDVNYKTSLKEVIAWFKKPSQKGFYFYGPPGTGKTHLACAIANYFALKKQKVACVHVPTLASKYPSSFFAGDDKEVLMNLIKKADCVVFDDIGAESYTSYFRDEVLFPLLNARMEAKQLTLFTSNHSLDALSTHFRYNHKGDDESIKSMRLLERIKTLAYPSYIQGINRRG